MNSVNDKITHWINDNIKRLEDTNGVSDGYHTFGELYEHRIRLYITLCAALKKLGYECQFSKLHNDGTSYDGWLLVSLLDKDGKQLSYHVDESKHRVLLEKAGIPEVEKIEYPFDGHSPNDVLERLVSIMEDLNDE